jgi:hypothetical protein
MSRTGRNLEAHGAKNVAPELDRNPRAGDDAAFQ